VTLAGDESDWVVHHSGAIDTVMWLTSWIRSGLIHVTLDDLLSLEEQHSGLMKDVDTLMWQIELIKEQSKGKK